MTADQILNHAEALELSRYRSDASNIARCYIDLRNRLARINAINDNPAIYNSEIDQLSALEQTP